MHFTSMCSVRCSTCTTRLNEVLFQKKIEINFLKNSKEKEKQWEEKKISFAWLQACFLGNVRVIWGNSHFGWILSTYHIFYVDHTTCKSLLNLVHMIVC